MARGSVSVARGGVGRPRRSRRVLGLSFYLRCRRVARCATGLPPFSTLALACASRLQLTPRRALRCPLSTRAKKLAVSNTLAFFAKLAVAAARNGGPTQSLPRRAASAPHRRTARKATKTRPSRPFTDRPRGLSLCPIRPAGRPRRGHAGSRREAPAPLLCPRPRRAAGPAGPSPDAPRDHVEQDTRSAPEYVSAAVVPLWKSASRATRSSDAAALEAARARRVHEDRPRATAQL